MNERVDLFKLGMRRLAAGVSLIVALPMTDEIGFALAAIFVLQHWLRARRAGAAAA